MWFTKKFSFGGVNNIGNESLAIDQMYARNKLRNKLVELDRKTREAYYAILNADNPEQDRIKAINEEIKQIRDAIRLRRIPQKGDQPGKRRLKIDVTTEKAQITALRAESEPLKEIAKTKREENKKKRVFDIEALAEDRKKAINTLRTEAIGGYTFTDKDGNQHNVPPLYNANADEIVMQHDTERSRAMKEKADLQFHRFDGEGRSCARVRAERDFRGKEGKERQKKFDALMEQIGKLKKERSIASSGKTGQEKRDVFAEYREKIEKIDSQAETLAPKIIGIDDAELFSGENTLMKIDPVNLVRDKDNPTVWDKSVPRHERRKRMRTVAHIRAGSDKDMFVDVPMVLHRPFPAGARIVSAAVNRVKLGRRFVWNAEFTVRYSTGVQEFDPKDLKKASIVAIDLGWAKDSLPDADGRIRAAGVLCRTPDGTEAFKEIALKSEYVAAAIKYSDLKSTLDTHTNEAFSRLAATATLNECSSAVQEILNKAEASRKARAELGRTPPVGHLRKAVWMVRKGEKASTEVTEILEKWYERYMHLSEWIANGRDSLIAWRNDYYRRAAYALAKENQILLLDPDDFAEIAKEPAPERGERSAGSRVRFMTGPSMFRNYLEEAFTNTGGMILWTKDNTGSSKTCSICGTVKEDLGSARVFNCANGHTADRELNACKNVMNAFHRNPGLFSTKKRVTKTRQEEVEKTHKAAAD